MPDAIAAALVMSEDPHCGRAVAFGTGTILTYIFDEEDLLPEASFGTLGLLDDAYLVHSFVDSLRRMYPFAAASPTYAAPDPQTSEVVAAILSQASRSRYGERAGARSSSPRRSSRQGVEVEATFEPELRVSEAVSARTAATASPG